MRSVGFLLVVFVFAWSTVMKGNVGGYEVEGKILQFSPGKITLQSGDEILEFQTQDEQMAIPDDVKEGDRVTVFYTLTAKKVRPRTAGQGRPREILDDRAFYEAHDRHSIWAPIGPVGTWVARPPS